MQSEKVCMFNFGKFVTENDITFDPTEIEKKENDLVSVKLCCSSSAAIKNVKITFNTIKFWKKNFVNKIKISPKSTDFLEKNN